MRHFQKPAEFRHERVASHLETGVLRAGPAERAGEVLERLAREKPASVELVAVTQGDGRFEGVVALRSLFAAPPESAMEAIMERGFPKVSPDADQEQAASIALHHVVDALPIVDESGRFLGVMPSQALLQVLRREHVEDLHAIAGIERESARARHAIDDPPMRRARHRLPWLLVGLAGSAVATAAMAGFEAMIQAHVAIAFFVPAIVYLADAIGTQSEAIAVRGLSLTRSGIRPLLAGELRTGMLIGLVLGLIALAGVYAAFGNLRLAVAVAISLFIAGSIAASIGLGLPWLFTRLGRDPAYGSGPVATVIQDVLSIFVYLLVLRALGF